MKASIFIFILFITSLNFSYSQGRFSAATGVNGDINYSISSDYVFQLNHESASFQYGAYIGLNFSDFQNNLLVKESQFFWRSGLTSKYLFNADFGIGIDIGSYIPLEGKKFRSDMLENGDVSKKIGGSIYISPQISYEISSGFILTGFYEKVFQDAINMDRIGLGFIIK
jgi:hypothetical protein